MKDMSKNIKTISISLNAEEMETKIDALTEKVSRLKSMLEEVTELIRSLSMD